ncbi:MAG: redoxin domain-containing protein [Thermoleophilia bacterium]
MGYNFGVGRQAPTFTISAVDGSAIDLKQYRGDWFALLVFVPTQAPDTAEALGQLSAAAGTLWGQRGQLLGICDGNRDDVKTLADTVAGLSFPLLPDDGTVAQAYGALKADGQVQPMAFIIDRAGKIVWSAEGAAALIPATLTGALRRIAR